MSPPNAIHAKNEDGSHHIVGIAGLRVVVVEDGPYWFAQGLDIDYAAQGGSAAEAKERFANGLAATINEHLRQYNSIEKLLQVAPQEVWNEYLYSKTHQLTQFTTHAFPALRVDVPFNRIEFLESRA